MTNEFLENLNKINKDYFTFSDFKKIWVGKENSLKVVIWRLIKSKKIIKVYRGIYILPDSKIKIEKLANEIYFPSYISFEYALYLWGILSQLPYTITFATTLKTKSVNLMNTKIEYRKIQKKLFFGYLLRDNIYLAWPEKALLDTFYLASLGKLKINFSNIDYSKINKKLFKKWAKKYPAKTQKLIDNYLID
mgnify:CR=1 FL=1